MAASLEHILAQIQRWNSPCPEELSDALLLERFVQHRDECAFAALVKRHGGMVLRSCRRVLGDVHAAEDAFQAAFLILARKAHALKRPAELPGWLHGVARRVALKARSKALGRTAEMPLPEDLLDTSNDPLTRLTARELLTVLDEEVARLSAAQRSAVVLCCLEGRTQEEAARILGWTLGSLKGHLQRGRQRLQKRLERRGIALSAALTLAAVRDGVAERVPAVLLQSTVRAALDGDIGGTASVLAHSVLHAMFLPKLAGAMAVMLTVALAASTTVVLVYRAPEAAAPEDKSPPSAVPLQAPQTPALATRVDRLGDPLPEGALLRLGTIRWRAGVPIYDAALSADEKHLATACESGIIFFDLATGKPRHLRESLVPIRYSDPFGSRLAFAPDGKQLVNITRGGNLRFWDVATGKRLRIVGNGTEPDTGGMQSGPFPPPIVAPPPGFLFFSKVWFTSGSPSVVACNFNNEVLFVDPSSGKMQRRFRSAGKLAAVASDGKTLAAIDAKQPEVILYDEKGKELRRFRHENKIELGTTLCLGGKRLVTVNEKAEIKIWDVATGKELGTLANPAKNTDEWKPTVVSISPDGNTLFAGTQGGDIFRWNLRDGKEQSPLRGHTAGFVTGLFPTKEGRSLVSASWDKMVHRWDLATGKSESAGEGYAGRVLVARSPDGRSIATASYWGRLEFWDGKTGKCLRAFTLPVGRVQILRFSPDGTRLALACSDAKVQLWDVQGERVALELKLPPSQQSANRGPSFFDGLAWSPDGRFLVTSLQGDGTRMWEAASGKEIWHEARRGTVAFSADGKTLVSGGWDECLTFQDAATGKVRFVRREKNGDGIRSIAYSPGGRSLAVSHPPTLSLRDPQTGEVRKTLHGNILVWSVSFSPDSKWLASGDSDGTVRIWEVATGAEVLCHKGHEGWVLQVEFGPNGRTVLSSSMDLTALLWDMRPRSERGRKCDLERLWSNLAGEPATAYRAIWGLTDDPKSASSFLRSKIAPVKIEGDERRVRALLTDLDSDDFDKRESASRSLAAMGQAVEGRLHRALTDTKSPEVQRRIRNLLDNLKREPTPEDFRRIRTVQVMEMCGTADALRVLRDWAGGEGSASITEQAKAALERLTKPARK